MTENLRIGVPSKGRLAEISTELLLEAGLRFRRQDRSLFARVKEMPIDITFLRTDDIPILCAEGAIDLGITGADLVAESGAELNERLNLGVGNCRLAVCVPTEGGIDSPEKARRQTDRFKFPQRHPDVFGHTWRDRPHGKAHRLGGGDDRPGHCRRDCRSRRDRQHAGG